MFPRHQENFSIFFTNLCKTGSSAHGLLLTWPAFVTVYLWAAVWDNPTVCVVWVSCPLEAKSPWLIWPLKAAGSEFPCAVLPYISGESLTRHSTHQKCATFRLSSRTNCGRVPVGVHGRPMLLSAFFFPAAPASFRFDESCGEGHREDR